MQSQTLSPAATDWPHRPPPLTLAEILPWALFAALLTVLGWYFIGSEQGAVSIVPGMGIHEFVHDGRHLLGFPCH